MPQALQRFEQAPERPPDKVIRQLGGHSAAEWRPTQVGYAGPFPNGGIWHYAPGLVVKRIGAQFPGGDPIWCNSPDPEHPHWWRREAEFYRSELATTGWTAQARPARCFAVDDGPAQTRDIWLEALDIPSLSLEGYQKAVASLANWQVATAKSTLGWLSRDWIPAHLERRQLDDAATLAHENWDYAIERGLDPRVRASVGNRVTDPRAAARRLAGYPHVLTHYDFHHCNIGRTPTGDIRIIDWAYAGWGPVGQDVGQLAVDAWSDLGLGPRSLWDELVPPYVDALRAAGWKRSEAEVRESIATATAVRHGWMIDHVLDHATNAPEEAWSEGVQTVEFVAGLIGRLPRE